MKLDWVGRLARNRIVWYSIIAVVVLFGVVFRVIGLDRSIWIDEAWVANSVTAGSLAGMFRYDAWLQTSPPLFLLLVRIAVGILGLSPFAFRLIPLLFGFVAVACMFILTRRVLLPRYAIPAWTLLVLSPVAIDYSKALKQYSGELAASTALLLVCILYLQRPTARRFWLLVAIAAVGLLMAYPVTFILPGIFLVVCFAPTQIGLSESGPARSRWVGLIRGFTLAVVTGGVLMGIYLLCIVPNTSPSLTSFFAYARGGKSFILAAFYHGYGLLYLLPLPGRVLGHQTLVGGVLVLFFLVGFILACLQFRNGLRRWLEILVICGLPCFLLIICNGLGRYPLTARTSLFLLPEVILLFLCNLQLILDFLVVRLRREWVDPLLDGAMVCATLLVVVLGLAKQPWGAVKAYSLHGTVPPGMNMVSIPEEDMASAVSYLRSSVQSGDIVWVHASCAETFKLYARMTGWNDAGVRFGHTGWPCCPRGIAVDAGSGKDDDVRGDLNSGVPTSFTGTVWLVYTNRSYHWDYVGVDQSKIMEDVMRERGCIQKPTPTFFNIGVSEFDCRVAQSAAKGVRPVS